MGFLTNDSKLDTGRCVKLALVHDMAEAIVGDITPNDASVTKAEKHRRELETMVYLTGPSLLGGFNKTAATEIMNLWQEYENISSPEARFVKDVDKLELILQTIEYEKEFRGKKDLEQFLGVRKQIKSPEVAAWADAAINVRHESWNKLIANLE